MVALNATGDTRFLGPSSGVFFAAFAASIARSLTSGNNVYDHPPSDPPSDGGIGQASIEDRTMTEGRQGSLSPHTVQFLLRSFEMWIQPLYPVLTKDKLRTIIEEGKRQQVIGVDSSHCTTEHHAELTIFYLVMALGAINRTNTIQQMKHSGELTNIDHSFTSRLSPSMLYSKSVHHFDRSSHKLQSNIWSIQVILLISIYGSYWPTGSSQWQLIGLAMRVIDFLLLKKALVANGTDRWRQRSGSITLWWHLPHPVKTRTK